jgi:hypothetical protein
VAYFGWNGRFDLNAGGSWEKIAHGHPCTVGSVEDHRITALYFLLHGIAAGTRPRTASQRTTQFG